MTIESTQVVYIVAQAGTGKSFSGDYLQVVHEYKHVDGNGPIKSMIIPKYREMTKNYFASGENPNLGDPYFEEIANQTLDAAKDHDRVVLTHATYNQESRDVVVNTLVEGGIAKENITVIELTIDPVVKLRGLYHRTKRQLELKGKTMEERHTHLEYEGTKLTEEKYIKAMMEQQGGDLSGGNYEDCLMATKVDVSDRVAHLSNLDTALGLSRSSEDWTYETICAQVIPIDIQRDEECTANGSMELLLELFAELRAASQEAPTQQASKDKDKAEKEESASSPRSEDNKQIERTFASSSWEMGRTKSWEDCNWEDYVKVDSDETTELSASLVSTPAA